MNLNHKYGYSYPDGKNDVQQYLWRKLSKNAKILDVGAGGGTYRLLLGPDYEWAAVEVWHDSAEYIKPIYHKVYEQDIRDFVYEEDYDLIIFGDVLEHLTVEDAQHVLDAAKQHTKMILVAVPYCLEQGPLNGNEAERHLQPDLTPETFDERYPGFEVIFKDYHYGYYFMDLGGQTYDSWFMCNP